MTICGLVIFQIVEGRDFAISDILANALTIIIGYYFGREVTKASAHNTS